MNTPIRRSLISCLALALSYSTAVAGAYHTVVFDQSPAPAVTIVVPKGRVMVITHFIASGNTNQVGRGQISVTNADKLTAVVVESRSLDDSQNTGPDVNNTIIAGPVTVTVYSAQAAGILTYKLLAN